MNLRGNIPAATVFVVLLAFCFALTTGCTDDEVTPYVPSEESLAFYELKTITANVSESFSVTLALAENTAGDLAKIDHNRTQMNTVLMDSQESLPWVDSAAFIDTSGVVIAIMPDSYSDLVGVDLSHQAIVQECLSNRSPVISDYMLLEEGEMGIVLEYPVFSEGGEFAGIVSFAIDPANVIEYALDGKKPGYMYSVMAAQPDGLILYDEDPEEIGSETFGNPEYEAYPSLIEFAEAYSSSPLGTYNYSFKATGSTEEVQKQAFWDTVEILDKEWRVMLIKEM